MRLLTCDSPTCTYSTGCPYTLKCWHYLLVNLMPSMREVVILCPLRFHHWPHYPECHWCCSPSATSSSVKTGLWQPGCQILLRGGTSRTSWCQTAAFRFLRVPSASWGHVLFHGLSQIDVATHLALAAPLWTSRLICCEKSEIWKMNFLKWF
jgi:hypothetical protein